MNRIDGTTAAATLAAPTALAGAPGYFSDGNPGSGVPATIIPAEWLNMLQEELMAILAAAGTSPSKATRNQVLASLQAIFPPAGRQITTQGLLSGGGTLGGDLTLVVPAASDAEAIAGTLATKALTPHSGAAMVTAMINALVNGAPTALDTLKELADAIGDDANFAATVTAALGARALTTRKINVSGLAKGGGDLTADRTIEVDAASAADLEAGTANDKAVTPAAFAGAGGTNSHGAWCQLPGGAIMQWGSITVAASGQSSAPGSITFPISFPTSCESITGNADDGTAYNWRPNVVLFPGGPSQTGCAVQIDSTDPSHVESASRTVWWKAIGR